MSDAGRKLSMRASELSYLCGLGLDCEQEHNKPGKLVL